MNELVRGSVSSILRDITYRAQHLQRLTTDLRSCQTRHDYERLIKAEEKYHGNGVVPGDYEKAINALVAIIDSERKRVKDQFANSRVPRPGYNKSV